MSRAATFSVVIPLYNKEHEISHAVVSALNQTVQPLEIIVVDDGSTDNGRRVVESIDSPLVRIISQSNAGVSAARNRGIASAFGEYIALLDGDDRWKPDFLENMLRLIECWPGCGAYSSAFEIVGRGDVTRKFSGLPEGPVENFFRAAMHEYIIIPSAAVIPRRIFDEIGGFPEGMKLGEDLHLWIRLASRYPICFTPRMLVEYSVEASNRSSSIYTPEVTRHSFEELLTRTEGRRLSDEEIDRNEFIARSAIGKALVLAAKGDTRLARRAERIYSFTRKYRLGWCKLWVLNRLPATMRRPALNLYNRLAWFLARKGL